SSISPKDALTPSTLSSSLSLPLRRRRLPLPVGGRPYDRRHARRRCRPSAGWPLAAGGASTCRRPSCWRRTRLWAATLAGGRPLAGGASAATDKPLQGAWPWVAGLTWGLAMGGQPYMGAGHDWPPPLLIAFAAKTQQECVE
ncbi:hypothetical protein B296_00053242, partial [Ensete ventricosum]